MFSIDRLDMIHESTDRDYNMFNVDTDQSTNLHEVFYKNMKNKFIKEYERFIKNEILPNFKDDILFQKFPTFRVSLPENVAVGGFHKDRDYNHSPFEINYFLPFSRSFETNTIWYERTPDNYEPMECDIGQYVEWDGANTCHGNKINKTGLSRVSIDFRVIRKSDYYKDQDIKSSITSKVKFDIGNYWKILGVS